MNKIGEYDPITTGKGATFHISIAAAKGLSEILSTSFGGNSYYKVIITKSGDIKVLSKASDLLREMEIQNPIARLIGRSVLNHSNEIVDGTNFLVILIGEFFKGFETLNGKIIHPVIVSEIISRTKNETGDFLIKNRKFAEINKENISTMVKSILWSELKYENLEPIKKVVVNSVLTVYGKTKHLNLDMIEILEIESNTDIECKWIKGIVLDHGVRQSGMPKCIKNTFILLCNFSLEYEKPDTSLDLETNSMYLQEKIFMQEREIMNAKLNKIIQLKRNICTGKIKNFIIINQKGIDNFSLERLHDEGIMAIRRAKKKNLERLSNICNCIPINSVDELRSEILGFAGLFYEQTMGEERYTIIENISNPFGGTIIIKGRNSFKRAQIIKSIEKTLKVLDSFVKDQSFLPGSGKIEMLVAKHLFRYSKSLPGDSGKIVNLMGQSFMSVFKKINPILSKKNYSESCNREKTFDGEQNPVMDCFTVKLKVINLAFEIIAQILLIDNIILGKGIM